MRTNSIRLTGAKKGTTSLILVGVHGDERCGIEAIEKILPELEIEQGEVIIEYGNPRAIEQNVRYTEANLNRMFKSESELTAEEKNSYEYARAQYLKILMNEADALLDIHASFTPVSRPFLICEANAAEIATQMPFDTIVSGFDAIEPGGTDYYMNANGKVGISVECGYLGDPVSTETAVSAIRSFLKARGHISAVLGQSKFSSQDKEYFKMHTLYLTRSDEFKLDRPLVDFQDLHAGQAIGADGEAIICADKDCMVLFARDQNVAGSEAFLLGTRKTAEQN